MAAVFDGPLVLSQGVFETPVQLVAVVSHVPDVVFHVPVSASAGPAASKALRVMTGAPERTREWPDLDFMRGQSGRGGGKFRI